MLKYWKNLTFTQAKKWLWLSILLALALNFGLAGYKYLVFRFNALDLAIFNQVFYNTSLGHWFQFTIHPTLYLADHFDLLILLLAPIYWLFKSPVTLLFLQSLFLALAAWPLYAIAKKQLSPLLSLTVVIFYLFNPVTWNINLFEFHELAFVPFFIFSTFYFYQKNNFTGFVILSALSLMIREDVAFVIFMFGLLAILDKKKIAFILTPLFLATAYFFMALKLVAYFSPAQTYKFLAYYYWLGETPLQILLNFFVKFPLVLQHVFTIANLELVLGFGLVFLFIPFYRPKYLLLALGMFMQIILGFASGELILRTHYGAVFLTAMSVAFIFSLQAIVLRIKKIPPLLRHKPLLIILTIVGFYYTFLVLSPLLPFILDLRQQDWQQVQLKKTFLQSIAPTDSVIATYDLIPNLSSRPQLYSLNYVFLGRQQYNVGEYLVPSNNKYLLVNFNDFLTFHVQYEAQAAQYYYQGDDNLRKLIADNNYQLIKVSQNLALWQKDGLASNLQLYQLINELPEMDYNTDQAPNDQIQFLGFKKSSQQTALYFKALQPLNKNYFIQINSQLYPLGYGLFPTSAWPSQQIVQINFYDLPEIKSLDIIDIQRGGLELDGLGSTRNVFDQTKSLETITLD